MMRIQLEQIRDRPLQWTESVRLTPEQMGVDNMTAPAAVEVAGQIAAVDNGFLLTIELETKLALRCDRCLEEFRSPVRSRVESLLLVEPEEVVAGEIELEEEALGLLRLDEPELDSEPLIVDQVQLAIPMSATCRADCSGLCPQCGANRNLQECDCAPPVDPRWKALKDL